MKKKNLAIKISGYRNRVQRHKDNSTVALQRRLTILQIGMRLVFYKVIRSYLIKFSIKFELHVFLQIILAIIWSNNQLGAAYYNILTSELFVMDDICDDGVHFNIMKTLYRQCQPRYVITISGTSDEFLTAIEALVMSETSSESNRSGMSSAGPKQVSLRVMRKKEHSFDRCYHRVRCLKLESEPANANNVERFIFLQGLLNFKSIVMIHALGLLLIYIDQHWSNIALDLSGRATFTTLISVTL